MNYQILDTKRHRKALGEIEMLKAELINFYAFYRKETFPKLSFDELSALIRQEGRKFSENLIREKLMERVEVPAGFSPDKIKEFIHIPGNLDAVLDLREKVCRRTARLRQYLTYLSMVSDKVVMTEEGVNKLEADYSTLIDKEEKKFIEALEDLGERLTKLAKEHKFPILHQGFFSTEHWANALECKIRQNQGKKLKPDESFFEVNKLWAVRERRKKIDEGWISTMFDRIEPQTEEI